MLRLGEGYLDSYAIVISPTGVEPPPNGNGEPPTPPETNFTLLAVLGLLGLLLISGSK